MNFGILMIQGLVNSFGAAVMAAFAAAVKIDSFAYMPAQEFGNAFSLFISQNYGGGKQERVQEGIRKAVKVSAAFCLAVSLVIFIFAPYLLSPIPSIGILGIWWAIPIGWFLADLTGILYLKKMRGR